VEEEGALREDDDDAGSRRSLDVSPPFVESVGPDFPILSHALNVACINKGFEDFLSELRSGFLLLVDHS
jgi:hypothetical protein